MRRQDFSYELPLHLIAQTPARTRSESRLLTLDGATGRLTDRLFQDLPELVSSDDLLVFNDTHVLKARLQARKSTGGRVEILIERLQTSDTATAQVAPARSQRPGSRVTIEGGPDVEIVARRPDGLFDIRLTEGGAFLAVLERFGTIPLPHYIERAPNVTDLERYQTVFARRPGSVAAPTAGLHFDQELLDRLRAKGVAMACVTLHVGAGTFLPVRTDEVEHHRMHSEWVEVDAATCSAVAQAQARGGRVIAVGTTSVRALETAAAGGAMRPVSNDTDLFITPGYRFAAVDAMVTNFHVPESTLLMLVCAFAGREPVLAAYQHAVRERYRFLSYGDAMFITRSPEA